jgi:hypothetical protein
MNQSESIAELAAALNKVQREELFALTDKENPFFKSKYADLSSVWSVSRKPLTDNGLSVVQTMRVGERDNPIIVTTLLHTSGQWIRGELEMPAPKKDPQQFGSAVTYGRRYSRAAMLGVCPSDDDAQSATEALKKELPKKTAPKSDNSKPTAKQVKMIFGKGQEHELSQEEITQIVEWWRKGDKLTKSEASALIDRMVEDWDALLDDFLTQQATSPGGEDIPI